MKIAVAMSGGVDSSVSAALLKRQGAQVTGVFMALAQPDLEEQLRWVKAVAASLDIPLAVIDLAEPFQRQVVDYFCDSYLAGSTPNPCMICNRRIKFGLLLDEARQRLKAELLATGHYVRLTRDPSGLCHLKKGLDPKKDQSYFLARLAQEQLARLCFPLGGFAKDEVYRMAAEFGLSFRRTAESQDVCFLKHQSVADFVAARRPDIVRPGPIITGQGRELGRHAGIHRYTVGQRRGLGLPDASPWYVTGLAPERNAVMVGKEKELLRDELILPAAHWLSGQPPALPMACEVKIRYRHPPCRVEIFPHEGGALRLVFATPQRAITPGQFAVFYAGDELIGSAEIK